MALHLGSYAPLYQRQRCPTLNNRRKLLAVRAARPAAGTAEGICYYFAYGSNLHRDALFGLDVTVLSRDPATVCDPDLRLVFRHAGGHATLQKLPSGSRPLFSPPTDASVHGVLYRLEDSELQKLCKRDGGYELSEVNVKTYSGQAVRAAVFVSGYMSTLPHEVLPTESYMRHLREGAADQLLDPQYQAWLSSIETVPGTGLPLEYWNAPEKYAGALLLVSAVMAVGLLTP